MNVKVYNLERKPVGDLELSDDGCSLTYHYDTKGEHTGITALLGTLHDAGIRFNDLNTRQSSLEEIFVGLVRQGR